MITDVNMNKADISDLLVPWGNGISARLDLMCLAEFPAIFFLTGSVADGSNSPQDLDFFVEYSPQVMTLLQRLDFVPIFSRYKKDPFVREVLRKEGIPTIDIQLIRSAGLLKKLALMKDFHTLAPHLPDKSAKKLLLDTLLHGYYQEELRR